MATRGGKRLDSWVLGGEGYFYYNLELLLFLSALLELLLEDELEEELSPNHFLNIDISFIIYTF